MRVCLVYHSIPVSYQTDGPSHYPPSTTLSTRCHGDDSLVHLALFFFSMHAKWEFIVIFIVFHILTAVT